MKRPRHHSTLDEPRRERLFVSASPGLEPALLDELREWAPRASAVRGGAEVEGPPGTHRTLNLQLRTATRVLIRIASFEARDLRALEDALARISLASFRRGSEPLRVEATTHRSRLSHSDRVREVAARVWGPPIAGDEPPDGDETLVQIRVEGDLCTVSVDSSGEILQRRGYRQEVSRAPLRETLAAGILRLATYRGDEPLWDPMCGSGTLAIEAAGIALRRAPGRDRSFAFQRWPGHDAAAFEEERAAARARELPAAPHAIHASDINAGALGTARRNARRSGVVEHLHLWRENMTNPTAVPPGQTGLLVTNPPYGKRVGEEREITPLYVALGTLLRERLPRWRAAVLLPDLRLERALDLPVDDGFDVVNGGIRCHLLVTRPHASR